MNWRAFFRGLGRAFDLFGTMRPKRRRRKLGGFEEDLKNLNDDRLKVEGDLNKAINKFKV
jgi:hypothetical protein